MVAFSETSNRIVRKSTVDFLCDRVLDLIEEKPFYRIKVKELCTYAGISRSTFYAHFDSVFDVVQKVEDDFLERFYPEQSAIDVLVEGDMESALGQIEFVRENSRVITALLGPNGDSYFSVRLVRAIEEKCERAWAKTASTIPRKRKDALAAYIAGGTLGITRYLALHVDDYDERTLRELARPVMAANRELLGTHSPDQANRAL